ncbi:putative subunit of the multisubunit Na+/H+ antiporter [Aciduliprofundum sp. MAR08-339]|nr:putative subunit of the multisubunit Na+/H+ antiporter [Aciduliprofundum sp. MAR08-339]
MIELIDMFTIVSLILIIVMIISAIIAAELKDLLSAAVALGVMSLVVSILFYMLQAPDVAITEAAIGAALSMAIVIFAVRSTKRWEK